MTMKRHVQSCPPGLVLFYLAVAALCALVCWGVYGSWTGQVGW